MNTQKLFNYGVSLSKKLVELYKPLTWEETEVLEELASHLNIETDRNTIQEIKSLIFRATHMIKEKINEDDDDDRCPTCNCVGFERHLNHCAEDCKAGLCDNDILSSGFSAL